MNFYIFGLGAIGSNLLVRLAQQYPDSQFFGFDFDKVEQRNIGTQAYFLQHIGHFKTVAMQSVLSTKLRKVNYKYYTEKVVNINSIAKEFVEQSKKGKQDSLIVDCFDNIESRKLLHEFFKEHCLHIGFSTLPSGEICWGKNYKVPSEMNPILPDVCDLTSMGGFINLTVGLSSIIIDEYIQKNIQRNFIIQNFKIIEF